jgi:hypothetical protein
VTNRLKLYEGQVRQTASVAIRLPRSLAPEADDAHFTLGRPVVNSAGGGECDVRSWNVIRSL